MASLTANQALDTTLWGDVTALFAYPTKLSTSELALSTQNGLYSLHYKGKFALDANGLISSGSIKTIEFKYLGSTSYSFTKLKTNYWDFVDKELSMIDSGDEEEFYAYLFSGKDIINGSNFNDFISMYGAGKDTLNGNDGNDLISTSIDATSVVLGGSGDDYLVALGDKDRLTGGAGTDHFVVLSGSGTIVTDYDPLDDYLVIRLYSRQDDLLPSLYVNTDYENTYEFFSSQVYVAPGASQGVTDRHVLIYDSSRGALYMDLDGVGGQAPELVVTFSNKPNFSADTLANQNIYVVGSVLSGNDGVYQSWLQDSYL